MARTLTAAAAIASPRRVPIEKSDGKSRNLSGRRNWSEPPAVEGGADKTLVASRGLAYYDRLAVAFETSLSERLSNYVGSDHSFLCTALSVAGTRRSGTKTVSRPNTDTDAAIDSFASGLAGRITIRSATRTTGATFAIA